MCSLQCKHTACRLCEMRALGAQILGHGDGLLVASALANGLLYAHEQAIGEYFRAVLA